jgi:predicted amidohydrolase
MVNSITKHEGVTKAHRDGGSPMAGTKTRWKVAAVQMTSTADVQGNVSRALARVQRAAEQGAALVALPENLAYLRKEGTPVELRVTLDGDLVGSFGEIARERGIHVLLGSVPEKIARSSRIYNTSVLIGPNGRVVATYRKMHLFDIDAPGEVVLRESRTVKPGDRPVVVDTPLGCLGLSICYDLRFPELYRHLALAGAEVLFVPAAFTSYTGPHHWLPLLRARAIENQCWIVAPAQVGRHDAERSSHGETVVIDPWGKVVARRARGEGTILAEIDREKVRRVRQSLPCLTHLRPQLLGVRRRGR